MTLDPWVAVGTRIASCHVSERRSAVTLDVFELTGVWSGAWLGPEIMDNITLRQTGNFLNTFFSGQLFQPGRSH